MRYKDYRTNETTDMDLSSSELVRRFLLHVLPKGFMRLRYYGFMANSIRRKSLAKIRESLGKIVVESKQVAMANEESGPACPNCHHGGMKLISIALPNRSLLVFRTN